MKGFVLGSLIIYCLTGLSLAQRCFVEKCSIDGIAGCKARLQGKISSAEECCQIGSAVGFSQKLTRVGSAPGCFQCDTCDDIHSKRDGKWGKWSQWSACSRTCGNGFSTRTRRCDSPRPSKLGKKCEGKAIERIVCKQNNCPIDGEWSEWSDWSDCTESCGQGTSFRTRACDNPAPANGGSSCRGSKRQSKYCNLIEKCPIPGGWSDWSPLSKCTKPCGVGKSTKTRRCNNPFPRYGGNPCEGKPSLSVNCNEQPCPIDGQWSNWSEYSLCVFSNCSDLNKGGHQTRSRSCTNPAPKYGGKMCDGKLFHRSFCVESDNCPSDGEWNPWKRWKCTDTGALRKRDCVFTSKFIGKDCEGLEKENKPIDDRTFCDVCPSKCRMYKGVLTAINLTPRMDSEESGDGSGDGSGVDGSGSGFGNDDEDGYLGSGYRIKAKKI